MYIYDPPIKQKEDEHHLYSVSLVLNTHVFLYKYVFIVTAQYKSNLASSYFDAGSLY